MKWFPNKYRRNPSTKRSKQDDFTNKKPGEVSQASYSNQDKDAQKSKHVDAGCIIIKAESASVNLQRLFQTNSQIWIWVSYKNANNRVWKPIYRFIGDHPAVRECKFPTQTKELYNWIRHAYVT